MHVDPIIRTVQQALLDTGRLAGAQSAVDQATSQLVEAVAPALRLAAIDLAQQAASEVAAQLPAHTVDVVLVDGDPTLRVGDNKSAPATPPSEDFDARITLRLPPSLKNLIEQAAQTDGESVNGWVVDALGNRARQSRKPGTHITDSFDL
jgi:hypothetical protein